MARQAAKNPRVSVLLAVRDAESVLMRTVESVLGQGYRDLELVVADCASADGTLRKLNRYAEHDFRVRVLELEDGDLAIGRDAALAAARGAFTLFMDQGDWLGPDYLSAMVAAADACDAELVISALSFDMRQAGGGRSSVAVEPAAREWGSAEELHRGLAALLGDRVLSSFTGKLLVTARLKELWPELTFTSGLLDSLALTYLDGASRATILQEPCYHVMCEAASLASTFDGDMFARVEALRATLLSYFDRWGLAEDDACMRALHGFHLALVIRCIENASLGTGGPSSGERRRQVQDMIDAPAVRASIEALQSSSKEFGLMFAPIARRSAAACCMGARIQDIMNRTLAPFTPARAVLR